MQSDYSEGARVRQVPIFVESRGENLHNSADRLSNHHQDSQPGDPMETFKKNFSDNSSQTLPNSTTSKYFDNIFNSSASAPRNISPSTQSYNDEMNFNNHPEQEQKPSHSNQKQRQPRENGQDSGKTQRAKKDQKESKHATRSQSANSNKNSTKLVGSPEPIPLPPPPAEQQQQNSVPQETSSNNNQGQSNMSNQDAMDAAINESKKDTSPLGLINTVKLEVNNLVQKIKLFEGTSAKTKEYRYLDEMLDRCTLKLDVIELGELKELRQQRKSLIVLVDKATNILQRKVQLNYDIQKLSEDMVVS